jgi:hypothetical protein
MTMIKLLASACIEAPAERVWARLAKLEDIQLWSELVVQARCDGALSHGVGAERTCELAGKRRIKEHWVAWEEGHSFAYEGEGIPLMKSATNRWSVAPHGDQAVLTSEVELELKGGLVGRLLEPIMRLVLRRMAPTTLAGFKYLVEHGQPYAGKASTLPKPSATC